MELWNHSRKVSDIISIHESDHKEVVVQMGQLTPLESIRFWDMILSEDIVLSIGDKFSIKEGDVVVNIVISHVIPLKHGSLARVPIPVSVT